MRRINIFLFALNLFTCNVIKLACAGNFLSIGDLLNISNAPSVCRLIIWSGFMVIISLPVLSIKPCQKAIRIPLMYTNLVYKMSYLNS